MDIQLYLIGLFVLTLGVIAGLVVAGGSRPKPNTKLTAEEHVVNQLLLLRHSLLSLPEADRQEVLLHFRQTTNAYMRLNGLSSTLAQLSAQQNTPLTALADGRRSKAALN